jgi:hypothetical protein
MQGTFWLAENYTTSFSGNTSFHGVSEFYPLTPVTANVLNARDFFHRWGSKIKKMASRRTHIVSVQHRDRDFDPFSGHGCISTWCCDVQEFNQTYSDSKVMRREWVLSLIKPVWTLHTAVQTSSVNNNTSHFALLMKSPWCNTYLTHY